jgi:uncharacterized protein YegJ (DUF2314 family)
MNRMRLPSLSSPWRRDRILLPLPDVVHFGFGVYFQSGPLGMPDPDRLQAISLDWLDAHCEDPVRSAVRNFVESGLVSYRVGPRGFLPDPPLDVLRSLGLGETEERRYLSADALALVSVADLLVPPRVGLWAALGSARAVCSLLQGVIIDPQIPNALPIASIQDDIPSDGRLLIPEHIMLLSGVNSRGAGWISSTGMSKFGLPNLEVRAVPADLLNLLVPIVNGVASVLTAETMRQVRTGDHPENRIELLTDLKLSRDDLARTYGSERAAPAAVRGWTSIRLHYERSGSQPSGCVIRLEPPASFRGDNPAWLYQLVSDLKETDNNRCYISEDNEAMEAAHYRAVSELVAIRNRFQSGLRAGETLFVKHGFPPTTEVGEREYMWVVVNRWAKGRVQGHLANDPYLRRDLHAGSPVDIRDDEIFDWLLSRPDGDYEGGYTLNVLLKQAPQDE